MRFVLLCLLIMASAGLYADDEAVVQRLDLNQAYDLVENSHPYFPSRVFAQEATVLVERQAVMTPLPYVKVEVENLGEQGDYAFRQHGEITLSVGKVLELGDKALQRKALASERNALQMNEQHRVGAELYAEVARRFVQVLSDQQRVGIAIEKRVLAMRVAKVVDQRIKAGKTSSAEQHQINIMQSRARLDLLQAEQNLAISRTRLAALWGDTEAKFDVVSGDLFALAMHGTYEELIEELKNSPIVKKRLLEAAVIRARGKLERGKRVPDVELAAGIRYLRDSHSGALNLSLSMPIGSGARAKPAEREQQLLLQSEELNTLQLQQDLKFRLYQLWMEQKQTKVEFDTLNQHILVESENVLAEVERFYVQGRYSLKELIFAQQALVEAREERLVAATAYQLLKIDIEQLMGRSFFRGEQL
ncbi:MAG: TolC family protein [Gammaproteobacteria bacterium]|nr:TolC family protein [Gammaproteobacteria bacterium]